LKKKYRDRTLLIAEILECAGWSPGELKTKILMKTQMNMSQIKKYFKYLEENGMLRQDKYSKRWFRTAKGESFLEIYSRMKLDLGDEI
jgi:predicted transcriptional regulator